MKKVPSVRPGGFSPSRSPNRSPGVLPSDTARSYRASTKNLKKIADAVDLLQKKRANARRTEEDLSNQEIYAMVLNERLTRKDAKFEKPNKKAIEAKKGEVLILKDQLEQLTKDLEARRETLELIKSFFGQLIREFRKHIRGYQESERERVDWTRTDFLNSPMAKSIERLRKSKSTNEISKNALQKMAKAVHFMKTLSKEPVQETMKRDEAVKAWAERRRPSLTPSATRQSRMPVTSSLDNLNVFGDINGPKLKGILAQALLKEPDERRSRTSTTRFQINHHVNYNPQNGVLSKDNLRQSLMGERESIVNIRDFQKMSKIHGKKSQVEVIGLFRSQEPKLPEDTIDEELSQANSNLSDSIIEEVKEELKSKMMRQNHASFGEQDNFDYKVVLPNFQPVKVSFKVGVNELRGTGQEGQVVVQKDRVYKNFAIHEIEWHFKQKGLCGVRIILKNWTTGFMLGGTFHGKIGEFVDVCKFNKDERIMKIEFAFDAVAIRFLEFVTTDGRKFVNGIDRKEALSLGLNFVNRYYPQEIMLCKFFCQFNKTTQTVDYVRFLFVRAILY